MALKNNEIIPVFKARSGQDGLNQEGVEALVKEIVPTAAPPITRCVGINKSFASGGETTQNWTILQDDVGAMDAGGIFWTMPVGFTHVRLQFSVRWNGAAAGYTSSRFSTLAGAIPAFPYYPLQEVIDLKPAPQITVNTGQSLLMPIISGESFAIRCVQSSGANLNTIGSQSWLVMEWYNYPPVTP